MRLHDLPEVRSNHRASFVSLGGDQGHGIGVICSIACVRVDEHIWLDCLKKGDKTPCVLAVHFDEIPIEIKVSSVPTKAIFLWSFLICSGATIPIQCATDIVHGHNHHIHGSKQIPQSPFVIQYFPRPRNGGIHTAWLSRMNRIIDEQASFGPIGSAFFL